MTSENAREMDRRCVLEWLYNMNTNPRTTLERYEDDLETLEILSYDAFMLLLTPQEKQQLRQERSLQRFFANTDGKIIPLSAVVRCKDCRYYEPTPAEDEPDRGWCNGRCSDLPAVHGDWFCADAERKGTDE